MLTIGTCSLCGGRVQIFGLREERPSCRECGAISKHKYGEIISMVVSTEESTEVD